MIRTKVVRNNAPSAEVGRLGEQYLAQAAAALKQKSGRPFDVIAAVALFERAAAQGVIKRRRDWTKAVFSEPELALLADFAKAER